MKNVFIKQHRGKARKLVKSTYTPINAQPDAGVSDLISAYPLSRLDPRVITQTSVVY